VSAAPDTRPAGGGHDPYAVPGKLTPAGADPIVRAIDLQKFYGRNHVLRGVTLEVYPRETICLIGRSGSGKSTLLRCINFLEEPTVGAIEVDGLRVPADPLSSRSREHREHIRQIRLRAQMVFQEFNLFPHLRVIDNLIEAPVRVKGVPRDQAIATAEKYLAKVGLSEKRDEYPSRLSGGQKQRVAIARALTMEPKVLLFDEPTSALDPTLVGEVLNVMEELAHEGATMIVVTHEMAFAREAADRVYYIDGGTFVEAGPPERVIDNPQDPRTRDFLARTLGEAHVHEGAKVHVPTGAGAVHIHAEGGAAHGFEEEHHGDATKHDEPHDHDHDEHDHDHDHGDHDHGRPTDEHGLPQLHDEDHPPMPHEAVDDHHHVLEVEIPHEHDPRPGG
jgi:ABC-type polar amino acid transport system ATPase subunit